MYKKNLKWYFLNSCDTGQTDRWMNMVRMAQSVAHLIVIVQLLVLTPLKAPVISLSKKLNSHCLVLVSSRN